MAEMVGIRELRQNLSGYVRRVRAGERFVITERGEPVGRLAPLVEDEDPIETLIAEGKLKPAKGDLLEVEPFLSGEEGKAILADLAAERGRTYEEAYGDR